MDRDIAYIRMQASPEIADRWYDGLIEAIASLSDMPTRCGVIPEQWLFDDEFRQLLYGRRQHKRRVFFIDDDTVYVVRYQHRVGEARSGASPTPRTRSSTRPRTSLSPETQRVIRQSI